MVPPVGNDPTSRGFHSRANPFQLQRHWQVPRDSNSHRATLEDAVFPIKLGTHIFFIVYVSVTITTHYTKDPLFVGRG